MCHHKVDIIISLLYTNIQFSVAGHCINKNPILNFSSKGLLQSTKSHQKQIDNILEKSQMIIHIFPNEVIITKEFFIFFSQNNNNNNLEEDDTADGTMKTDITHRIYRIKFARTSTQMYSCSVACTILNARQHAHARYRGRIVGLLALFRC